MTGMISSILLGCLLSIGLSLAVTSHGYFCLLKQSINDRAFETDSIKYLDLVELAIRRLLDFSDSVVLFLIMVTVVAIAVMQYFAWYS